MSTWLLLLLTKHNILKTRNRHILIIIIINMIVKHKTQGFKIILDFLVFKAPEGSRRKAKRGGILYFQEILDMLSSLVEWMKGI